jgi:hypothetical protein
MLSWRNRRVRASALSWRDRAQVDALAGYDASNAMVPVDKVKLSLSVKARALLFDIASAAEVVEGRHGHRDCEMAVFRLQFDAFRLR